MKRNILLAAAFVLVVLFGIGAAYRCALPPITPPTGESSSCVPFTPVLTKIKTGKVSQETMVQDMVAILNETQSPETFAITVAALSKMGRDAKPAVPAIIRNADRLEFFKDLFDDEDSGPSKMQKKLTELVMEAIDQILAGKSENRRGPCCDNPTGVLSGGARGAAPAPKENIHPAMTSY
jgi:hypothetical protein